MPDARRVRRDVDAEDLVGVGDEIAADAAGAGGFVELEVEAGVEGGAGGDPADRLGEREVVVVRGGVGVELQRIGGFVARCGYGGGRRGELDGAVGVESAAFETAVGDVVGAGWGGGAGGGCR